jgi:hypothetical protein
MATSDPRDYFTSRIAQEREANAQLGISTGYDTLQDTSRQKIADLQSLRKEIEVSKAAQAKSWVGQLDLNPDGVLGSLVNYGALGYSTVSRMAGEAVSLLPSVAAMADESSISPAEMEAYTRKTKNLATPEDIALLNRKKAFYAERDTPEAKARAQELADRNPSGLTALDLIERSTKMRGTARDISDSFDRTSVIHAAKREDFLSDVGQDFEAAWNQTGLANTFEKDKSVGNAKDVVTGLAKLVYNAGEAAVKNPKAASEYMAENLPQLLVGGAIKGGKYVLSATNAGYAADTYQKGLEKYANENNGAFPPAEERQYMAMMAAAAGLAEQAGELGQLAAIGKVRKAIPTGEDAARIGFKQSLLNTGKATATGLGEESVTEGFQTYAEGEAGRTPASAKDIYTSGVIGGISGGGLAGSGRAVAETLGATPEKVQARADDLEKNKVLDTAIQSGDVSLLLNPKEATYAPDKAIAALYGNSQLPDATPETKAANLEKAAAIVADLQEQKAKEESYLAGVSPAAVEDLKAKAQQARAQGDKQLAIDFETEAASIAGDTKTVARLQTKIARIDRQLTGAQQAMENFYQESQSKELDVTAEAAKVNDADPVVSKPAADSIINLSMATPERLDAGTATSLAENTNNALTTPQRAYLRAFSAARAAENLLKDMGKVSQEIFYGGKGMVGIQQYRSNVATFLAAGNRKAADTQMSQLGRFVKDHQAKAAVGAQALQQFQDTGKPVQLRTDGKQGWFIHTGQPLTVAELRKEGSLEINETSAKIVNSFGTEAAALQSAQAELQAAYDLKFNPTSEVSNVKDVSQTSSRGESTAVGSETKAANQDSADAEGGTGQRGAAADVQTNEAAGAGSRADATEVTEEAPASAVTTAETKTAEGQLQSTEDDNAVDEASPNADEAAAEIETGKLSVLDNKSPEGTEYQLRNLIADYFTQSASREGDVTTRPLVEVKNFLTQTAKGFTEFITDKTLSVQQQEVIKLFREKATEWMPKIQANLALRTKNFRYEDLSQFLISETDGKLDLDENVKTAISYAVFSWVAENAARSQDNTDEEINAILDRDESANVTVREKELLGNVGTRENVVRNTLGQRIVQALGLKATQDAPVNLQPDLEAALGAHAWKLMMDLGLIQRSTLSGTEMAELTGKESTDTNADFHFVKLARDNTGNLTQDADAIIEASLGSRGVLDKVFSVESGMKEPSLEPIPFTQTKTRNTSQNVPEKQAKIVEAKNAEANYVRQDMWQIVTQLGETVLQAMAGVEEVSDDTTHITNRSSLRAKNDGLIREINRFMQFVGSMADIEAPMYFEHSVWKQQRVGIATNVINPQTSKVHRFMLFRKNWETKVDMNNQKQMDNFRLRVLEGLGVKTDKQSNATSLASYESTVNAPVIKDAVEVLRKATYEGGITEAEQQTLLAGVMAGKQKFHSLDALMALAHEAQAKQENKSNFTVHMMGEIDGVTNGPMLSHLLLGAAALVKNLFGLLNRGGFFEKGNADSNYNVWRGKPGSKDLYEITGAHIAASVRGLLTKDAKLGATLDAVYAFTGDLTLETPELLKNRREIVKKPLTAMVFGSSVSSAVDGMADAFVETIYSSIEKLAEGKGDAKQVLNHINTLLIMGKGPSLKPMSVSELMEYEFTQQQVKAIKKSFKDTLGKAVAETMQADFQPFIEKRDVLNRSAQLSFEIYNAAYTSLRDAYLAKLVAANELAVDANKQPLHDLNAKQLAELKKRVNKLTPIMHTAMSKDSGSLNAGLYASKTGRKLSSRSTYKSSVRFGTPVKGTKVWSSKKNAYVEQTSVEATAFERTEMNPGVAMVVMSTHATDSAISHNAADGNEVLNVHDAHGSGLGTFEQTAKNLNKATWDAMLNYSPASEMFAMLSRTVQGLAVLSEQSDIDPAVMVAVKEALTAFAEKNKLDPDTVLTDMMVATKTAAFEADTMRLEALAQMGAVDQYALEGGQYEVSDDDRAAAMDKSTALNKEMTSDESAALVQVASSLGLASTADAATASPAPRTAPKPTVESVFGPVGTPAIESEGDLVEFFALSPKATAKEVIALLAAPGRLNPVNRKILQLISRTVSPELSIQFVTPDTAENQVLDKPTTNARGWYVAKNGAREIHVLSPEFLHSGLTSETLLHELVHAAIAEAIANPSAAAKELIAELDALRIKAKQYADANGLTQFNNALADVQEFAAWGMTNIELQRDVLNKITMKSTTGSNKLVTGMQKFISTLTQLLFKKPDTAIDNGLSVLVINVSGLFYEAAQSNQAGTNLNLAQASGTDAAIDAYTTLEIHEALDTGALEPSFKAHLANLLTGIVESLHGPFGAFAAEMRKTEASTPMDVWLKAIETGKAPFASSIVASGLAGSEQELFAMQQIEATVKAALDGNESLTKLAYKQLAELYKEARATLKPSDFASQEEYDFVFRIEAGDGGRSDYLARFAALGLGNQKVNALLKFNTKVDTRRAGAGQTITERLENLFEKIVAFFAEKITHAYGGQAADQKLVALVDQLVDIEARKRHAFKLRETTTNFIAPVEDAVRNASDAARAKISQLAGSDMVRKNKNAFVRAAGGLARTYANDQVEWFLEGMQRLRDQEFKGRLGVGASFLAELKGPLARFNALLRETKHLEQTRKSIITQQAALSLKTFINEGKDLTKESKAAISAVFLRTGMHNLLAHFTSSEMENLLNNSAAVEMSIDAFESQLTSKMKNLYIAQANALGYYKATGRARSPALMLNAHLIARMAGTQFKNQISEAEATAAEPIITALVTLYALKYSDAQTLAEAKEVFRAENNRDDGNGVEFVLALHQKLEADSLQRLFKGNPALMIHGYTPEIFNPHTAIAVADAVDGADLKNQGYSVGAEVTNDRADPDQSQKRIYVLRDGGLAPWVSGVFSLSSMKAKGAKKHNGYMNVSNQNGLDNALLQATISNAKLKSMQSSKDPHRDLSKDMENHMVPVFNEMGEIVNWRYMMAESTKDALLERDNRFEQVLGTLAGSIFDKSTSREQNMQAITALREQYEAEYATRQDSYILVGERSDDPEMRAIWNLLPENTKRDVRAVWGRNGMMVRSDSLDIMFGYRKLTLATMFQKDPEARNKLEKLFVGVMETVLANYGGYKLGLTPKEAEDYAKRAAVVVTRGERAWQELVHEVKDIIVVKTGFVMLGNIWSNLSLLAMSGVSLKDILHHHLVAMKGATAYQRDNNRLMELQTRLELGYVQGDEAEIRREILILQDAIARNPVKELIDAGLMPTIVEDVAAEENIYSYKSKFARDAEKYTDKLNPNVKAAARMIYMTHDTQAYQALSRITQLSDFVARYTLYQHLTTKQKDPLSKAEAIQEASDAFVNYDIPMHRGLQYSDDMGIIPFTKYFLRIQRVLLKLTRENPARVFTTLLLNNYLNLGPIVLDSSFIHHLGNNPFHSGAFQLPGTLDELATVNAAMAVFK